MARPKKIPPTEQAKDPLKVSTLKLTRADIEILQHLTQDASDNLGWTVSISAVMRAIIRHTGQQEQDWIVAEIYPQIESEIAAGRVWGYKKSSP